MRDEAYNCLTPFGTRPTYLGWSYCVSLMHLLIGILGTASIKAAGWHTDAFKCFMGTELDLLAVGNYLLYKEHQNEALRENYEERYELD